MPMKMKAMQVTGPRAEFELVEKPIPEPGENEVLLKVEACGVCHGDAIVKEGQFPHLQYPRVPGHEVVAVIERTGSPCNVGSRVSESVSGGTAGTASCARRAATGPSGRARRR